MTGALRPLLHAAADRIPWLDRLRSERHLRNYMRDALGYEPDLRHPCTFNERIARKILDDRDPLIPLTLDKVRVRDWIAGRIGAGYLVPLLGVWRGQATSRGTTCPPASAPKTNHGCGYNIIVADKPRHDRAAALRQLEA